MRNVCYRFKQAKESNHIVINNGAHENVGGMLTVAADIDVVGVAKACGYSNAVSVDSFELLDRALEEAKSRNELCFIEVLYRCQR